MCIQGVPELKVKPNHGNSIDRNFHEKKIGIKCHSLKIMSFGMQPKTLAKM